MAEMESSSRSETEIIDVNKIIAQLLENRGKYQQVTLQEEEIRWLISKSKDIFLNQPTLLELKAPIKICGDLRGQYYDLLHFLERGGFPPESDYLFLGNYVNRGNQSLETICLLLAYKIRYPEQIFLLRGRHECAHMTKIYGFYHECKRRYSVKLWEAFTYCFDCMPVAAVIDKKIFCVHGGLSPELHSLDQIREVARPIDVPEKGLLCDLLWSEPKEGITGWCDRDDDISFSFGADVVEEFLQKNQFDLICRSHQVVKGGYQFFANRQLVTVFSATDCYYEFNSAGAMMAIDESLQCSFHILVPGKGFSVQ